MYYNPEGLNILVQPELEYESIIPAHILHIAYTVWQCD